MLIREALAQARALTGQVTEDAVLVRWLSELDGTLAFEFYGADAWTPYDPVEDVEHELLVPFPWDRAYIHHLEAMTYYSNGEYDRVENARVLSERALDQFRKLVRRTHAPVGPELLSSAGGSGITVIGGPGSGPWFYLSAYAEAVKHGFQGTAEEWLESLVGPKGDVGAAGPEGPRGAAGPAAGFGTVTASKVEDGGAPGVSVTASGADTAKNFAFTFRNLKGPKGDPGAGSVNSVNGDLGPEILLEGTDISLGGGDGRTVAAAVSAAEARLGAAEGRLDAAETALAGKQDALSGTAGQYVGFSALGAAEAKSMDSAPVSGSGNPVTSGGVYAALAAVAGEKQDKALVGSVSLSAAWTDNAPLFSQTVTVDGVTVSASSKVDLQPAADQLAQLAEDGVSALVIENNAGALTAYAVGAAVSTAMTVQCTIIEVSI